MIAKVIDCAAPGEAPGPFQASGGFRAHWAAVMAGGTARARVVRVRVTGCRSADPDWAVREIAATQALAGRRSRAPKTYRLLVSGVCQRSCPVPDQAASLILRLFVSRSGLRQTSPTGDQFRIWRDHRAGLAARASV